MRIDNNSAAVDNDFIAKVAQTRKSSMKHAQILLEIFRALNVQGVIHPLVYDKEVMQENPIVQSFFVEQVINRLGFEDIFQGDEDKRAYYMFLVPELYYALRGEQLPEGTNVLTYWKRKCSLGEIHTVSMCLVTSWITENLYNSFLKKFSQEIGTKKQFVQEAKIIDTNSKNNERKKSLRCNYFLLEKGQYNNDYLAAIRLYKMESSYLAVPYIFLSSLKSKELLSLCKKIQNYRAFPQTENVRSLVQYFAQNWTASEIESCQDVGVFIYQAVVNLLSDKIFYEIVCEIGMGNIADDIELCFDSRESFEVQEERKENLESLHDLICHSTHSPTQLLSFNQYMKEGVKPSKNSDIPSDIFYCERTLANSRDKNGTFLDAMKRYFTVLRKDDNIRAKGQQHRLYGIPVDKIVKCFAPAVADHSFSKVAPYYMDLIYLWDTGLATCVILPNINETNDMLAFSEVIRHGEQAFRAIYSIYPNEYSVLRRYASVTDSYTKAEILPFAKWCTVCYPTLKMMEFLNKIEFEAFFSDCIAVLPDSVQATLCDEEIDEMIDCYRNRN